MKAWEDICSRCGLCCMNKAVTKDFLILDTSYPCEHLDMETKLCKVYDTRFKECSRCRKVTPFMAAFSPVLPSACAYVRLFSKYHIRFSRKETLLTEGFFNPDKEVDFPPIG